MNNIRQIKRLFLVGIILSLLMTSFAYAGGPKPKLRRAKSTHSRSYHLRKSPKKSAKQSPRSSDAVTRENSASTTQTVQRQVEEAQARQAVPPIARPKITPYNGPTLTRIQWATKFMDAGVPLPAGWQDMTPAGLKFAWNNEANYYLMKSSGEMPSRFRVLNEDGTVKKGTDTELAEWAHSQPDWYNGKHYIFDGPYMEPFNSNVRSMRVLVINDSQAVLEPLLEAAAKNSRVEIYWEPSVVDVVDRLKQNPNAYDVILTDYCMQDGTAVAFGMQAYAAQIATPIVFYSRAGAKGEWLLQFNIIGRIDMALTDIDGRRVLNYLSNVVNDFTVKPEP